MEKDGGGVRRVADPDIQSSVLEVEGGNVAANFVTCPADPAATLGIKLPLLVLLVKPLAGRLFSFEVHVLDDKNVRRRFRASNFQSAATLKTCMHVLCPGLQSLTRVKPYICTMPLLLDDGWNQIQVAANLGNRPHNISKDPCEIMSSMILARLSLRTVVLRHQQRALQFNLADFTKRAYGTNYVETLRVQVHANCRIRRIYFSDRLYAEDELPPEFKLYLPIQKA
eukprot:SM000022S07258  [mRNA]  locus=s22:816842:818173:+ [translate_table: standard]